jgi:hypothetical protein
LKSRKCGGLIDSAKNFYPEEPEEYNDVATAESAFIMYGNELL